MTQPNPDPIVFRCHKCGQQRNMILKQGNVLTCVECLKQDQADQ